MKRIITTILAAIMAINLNVFAMEDLSISKSKTNELSAESIEFLKEHNVDMNIFEDTAKQSNNTYSNKARGISYNRSNDDIVKSVMAESEAYNFSDEQIEQLVNSSINADITFIVPDNNVLSRTDDLESENRPSDDGVGYEVESIAGFHTTTAFATFPDVYTGSENNGEDVAGYMFWTVNGQMDIGLCYSNGWNGDRWRFCWLYAEEETLQTPDPDDEQSYIWLQSADEVYLRVTVVDNNWVLFEMYNADNFNQTKSYSVYTGGLGITRTNAQWRRQITLCTSDEVNETVVFDGGAYLRGAEFSECYIYSGTGTSGITTYTEGNYVNPTYCGKFGIDDTSLGYVEVVDYDDWYYEKINIQFPQ